MDEIKPRKIIKRNRLGTAPVQMAVDVDIDYILNYLCDVGSGLCPRCPSRCAYGRRYLKEILEIEVVNDK